MMYIVKVALAVFALAFGGCQTVQHNTPSGKAEVQIANVTTDQVKAEIVNGMMTSGWIIQQDTPYALSFDKPVQNVMAAALLGSQYDATPTSRVTFVIAQNGPNVRIVTDIAIITNPGSGFERRTPTNNSADGAHVQAMLDGLAGKLNPSASAKTLVAKNIWFGAQAVSLTRAQQLGQKCPGQALTQQGLCLMDVAAGSPAAAAGLKKGDLLLSINDKPLLIETDFQDTLATLTNGQTVVVRYQRKGGNGNQPQAVNLTIGTKPQAGV
jgi:hypothetical protein